jgi:hypothetical protein
MSIIIRPFSAFLIIISIFFSFHAIADGSVKKSKTDLELTCEKSYRSSKRQLECINSCGNAEELRSQKVSKSKYMERAPTLRSSIKKLLSACQMGQVLYLKTVNGLVSLEDLDEALRDLNETCDQLYEHGYEAYSLEASACKIGVKREDERKNPKKKGLGTSSDVGRETGR